MIKPNVITASYQSHNNYGVVVGVSKAKPINFGFYLFIPSKIARLFMFMATTTRLPSVAGTSCWRIPGNKTNIFGLGCTCSFPEKIIGALFS